MKSENGITILALAMTITIMFIIAFVGVYTAKGVDENVDEDMLIQELNQVHHIVLEEYNKELTLGDDYNYINTTSLSSDESTCINYLNLTGTFYKLTPENLKSIGAKNVASEYLVCYDSGTVINYTKYTETTNIADFTLYIK